jgi:hypothetical protein
MTDDDLLRLGFVRLDNGTFLPPRLAAMRLVPVGKYIELQIIVGNGGNNASTIKIVVHRSALRLDEGVKL